LLLMPVLALVAGGRAFPIVPPSAADEPCAHQQQHAAAPAAMPAPVTPPAGPVDAVPAAVEQGQMQHGTAHGPGMTMLGQFGPYPMSRDASGTSWQPDSTSHQGVQFMAGEWSLMGHANILDVYDHQGGPRGGSKTFVPGMIMGLAQRPVGNDG
jgi:hypothetical protein